ncbi:MAG: tetratricopeptide repeat protein, partial [Rhodothermales bacterium]|nr:tetratricopeptide repeat protein [Rhodothermales bacterium]
MPRRFLAALVLVLALSGCGRLLGQRYDNFTAYYNTFYNARQEFERAEEALLTQERPVDRTRYLPLFVEVEGTRDQGFTKAVEKGADLLRENPESKWVDDALLLIGKAYYYQDNLVGAEQKFRETIALEEARLEPEAYLWLGRTLMAAERFDDAALTLREGLDLAGLPERWAAPMRLALGELAVRQRDWEAAAEALETGLDDVRDNELAARAAFLLGQVYETLDRPEDAAAAYERVRRYGPRYELAYAADLQRALALGLHGRTEEALDLLRRMRRDDKNFDNLAEVELTRARVLAAAGQPGEAEALLRRLLYDPDPALQTGSLRGPLHYRLAEVYRDRFDDYVRAAAHLDTAATALRQAVRRDELFTPEAVTDAPELAETFGSYAEVAGRIAEMDSLLYLGGLDDAEFEAAIEEIRQQRQREAELQARELERQRREQGFGAQPLEGFPDRGGGGQESDTGIDAGFLNYRDPVRVQAALAAFQSRWGDRPYVPNWRRASAVGGGVAVQ